MSVIVVATYAFVIVVVSLAGLVAVRSVHRIGPNQVGLVTKRVLTRREIAKQQRATYEEQQRAETARVEMEKARGTADMQAELATAQVSVDINDSQAKALEAKASGEAAYVRLTGAAEADKIRAVGLAEAKASEALGLARAVGFRAQSEAIGELPTALVAMAGAVAEGGINVVPEVLVTGNGSTIDGLAGALIRKVRERPVKPSADGKEAVAAASR